MNFLRSSQKSFAEIFHNSSSVFSGPVPMPVSCLHLSHQSKLEFLRCFLFFLRIVFSCSFLILYCKLSFIPSSYSRLALVLPEIKYLLVSCYKYYQNLQLILIFKFYIISDKEDEKFTSLGSPHLSMYTLYLDSKVILG